MRFFKCSAKLSAPAIGLLVLCLLSGLPSRAQSPAARQAAATLPRRLSALDSANGFRTYIFGSRLSDWPAPLTRHMATKDGQVTVSVPGESAIIGDLILTGLRCTFYNGRLSRIDFQPTAQVYTDELLRLMKAMYGPGQPGSYQQVVWKGNVVTLVYEPRILGHSGRIENAYIQGQASLFSNALLADYQADEAALKAIRKEQNH
jgi:hypothetical protein